MMINTEFRNYIENQEAKMWKCVMSYLLFPENRPPDYLKNIEMYEATLKKTVEVNEFKTKLYDLFKFCDCGKDSNSRCGAECGKTYCSKECQLLDWKKHHKHVCKLKEEERASYFTSSEALNQKTDEKSRLVLVMIDEFNLIKIYMSFKEMTDYTEFSSAVKQLYPKYDPLRHSGWSVWRSIRELN